MMRQLNYRYAEVVIYVTDATTHKNSLRKKTFEIIIYGAPHCAPQSIGDYGGPNLMGCRGMGTEIGAGVSRTRTDPDCITIPH